MNCHESNFVMCHRLFLHNVSVLMNKQLFISNDFVQKICNLWLSLSNFHQASKCSSFQWTDASLNSKNP
jgi:hypothetical protein